MDHSISIVADSHKDFIKKLKDLAKIDKPEGYHFIQISPTFLLLLIEKGTG